MKSYKLLAILALGVGSCSSDQQTTQAELSSTNQIAKPESTLNTGAKTLVEKSPSEKSLLEFKQLNEMAELGDTNSMLQLAWKYQNGDGIEKDNKMAVQWYTKAAEKGDSIAQDNLGILYRDGIGVSKMPSEAAKWFELSAKQGNPQGQGNFGQLFFEGVGVKKDITLAYAWSAIAVKNGNSDFAKKNMDLAKAALKPDQLTKADALVAQWKLGQAIEYP